MHLKQNVLQLDLSLAGPGSSLLPVDIAPFTDNRLLLALTPAFRQTVEWLFECLYLLMPNLSRRQLAPHSFCAIARVVFEEGKLGWGVLGRGSRGGCIAKRAASKKQPGRQACLQLCVREEAGRFAWLLLAPFLAFLGFRRKSPDQKDWRQLGVGAQG